MYPALILLVLISSGIITVFIYSISLKLHTLVPQKHPIDVKTTFIADSIPSKQTITESKVVAEKLNLERKIIAVSNTQSVSTIRQIIEKQGGKVVDTNQNILVVEIPKVVEKAINESLSNSQISTKIEVDYPTFLTADTPDWGVSRIKAPDVWQTTGGDGIRVAVIDTGVDYSHPDISGRYGGGYDTVGEDTNPFDDHGHGTHVSGIIVSDLNGSGMAGVAPRGQIVAVKALGADGSGYISDLVEAIDWAMKNNVQIINFSLGTTYDSQVLRDKINQAASQGIILVAAAGNTNGGALLYPAAYGSVISVAATTRNDSFASFSSVGAEIAAPGDGITSTVPGGGYATWSGTSMAAPHVTATVALMIANKQNNIREALHNTAIDLGPSGKDSYFGYGLVHAKPAALGEDTLAPAITFLTPENNANLNGKVEVKLSIQDEHKIKKATLFMNNQTLQSWDVDPYVYEWDTNTLADGEYILLVQAIDEFDNTGEAKITITKSKSASTPTPTLPITPKLTINPTSQISWQGKSQEVRQDANQPAQEHRQNHEHMPNNPGEAKQEQKDNPKPNEAASSPANETQSAPDVSNHNQRNQREENGQKETGQSEEHKKNVKGASTTYSFWQRILDIFGL